MNNSPLNVMTLVKTTRNPHVELTTQVQQCFFSIKHTIEMTAPTTGIINHTIFARDRDVFSWSYELKLTSDLIGPRSWLCRYLDTVCAEFSAPPMILSIRVNTSLVFSF